MPEYFNELVELVDNTVKRHLQTQPTEHLLDLLSDRTQLQPVAMILETLKMRHHNLKNPQASVTNRIRAREALALTGGIDLEDFSTEELLRIHRIEASVSTLSAFARCLAERVDCSLRQFLRVVNFNGMDASLYFSLLRKKCDQTASDEMLTVLDSLVENQFEHCNMAQSVMRTMMEREGVSADQAIRITHHCLGIHNFGDEYNAPRKEWLKGKLLTIPWDGLLTYLNNRNPASQVGSVLVEVMRSRVSEISTKDLLVDYDSFDYYVKEVVRTCLESRTHDLQTITA